MIHMDYYVAILLAFTVFFSRKKKKNVDLLILFGMYLQSLECCILIF